MFRDMRNSGVGVYGSAGAGSSIEVPIDKRAGPDGSICARLCTSMTGMCFRCMAAWYTDSEK